MIIFCAAICIKTQQFIIPYAGLGLMFNFAPASRVSSSFIGDAGNSKLDYSILVIQNHLESTLKCVIMQIVCMLLLSTKEMEHPRWSNAVNSGFGVNKGDTLTSRPPPPPPPPPPKKKRERKEKMKQKRNKETRKTKQKNNKNNKNKAVLQ